MLTGPREFWLVLSWLLHPQGRPTGPIYLSGACQDKSHGMKYLLILLTSVDLINYGDFLMNDY